MYFIYLYIILINFLHTTTISVTLGDTQVKILKRVGQGKTFVHLHSNEVTALHAAQLYVGLKNGTLITLKHKGTRNIAFNLDGIRYEFDPNRMFTDVGIQKTLLEYGEYSTHAHQEIKKLATAIINVLPDEKIIAVHNNNEDYSIKEYFPDCPLVNDAKAFYYQPETNYRNFYFVTQDDEFNRLKKLNFNVALQAPNAVDDGSLSFYFSDKNYINIEAGYGELLTQLKMLYVA